jgi:hypothetical protein
MSLRPLPASRSVYAADALVWLAGHRARPGTSVVTSLPDVSELPRLGFEGWRRWFVDAVAAVLRWLPDDGVAVFYQTDVRHAGAWVDKSYLVLKAAEAEGAALVWHKIVCRRPPGTIAVGRPTYAHMLCLARRVDAEPKRPGPDVLADAGPMSWSRATGEAAIRLACRFLRDETATRFVVDPFCGEGSVLAVANAYGFAATGVDLSAKRCRAALRQQCVMTT